MKKLICGFLSGVLFMGSVQIYAEKNDRWNQPYQSSINDIGRALDDMNNKLDKIYSKMKSIDERLEIENNK